MNVIQEHLYVDMYEGVPRNKAQVESTAGAMEGEANRQGSWLYNPIAVQTHILIVGMIVQWTKRKSTMVYWRSQTFNFQWSKKKKMASQAKAVKSRRRKNPKKILCSIKRLKATPTLRQPVVCHFQICNFINLTTTKRAHLNDKIISFVQERYWQSRESQSHARSDKKSGFRAR